MARYYASRIERGFLTLDRVPKKWREETLQILIDDGYYDEDGNPIEWMLNSVNDDVSIISPIRAL